MAYIAEGAAAGADVTHDHEGGGAVAKAFAKVGAACFFANGMQFLFAQNFFQARDFAANWRFRANPIGLALRLGSGLDFDRNARHFFFGAEFYTLGERGGSIGSSFANNVRHNYYF